MTTTARRLDLPGILDMMQAYKVTALLNTAIELGVFDRLALGPAPAPIVACDLGLDARGGRLLLNALAAIGLLESDGRSYALRDGADAHLVRGRTGYAGDMFRVMASRWEWDALQRLPDAVRRGGTVLDEHAETPEYEYWEDFAAYAHAVAAPTARMAAEALRTWADARTRLDVLDVACGHGLYGFTFAREHPRARVWSLDWPNVLPIACEHARELGVADRVTTIPGDMFEVPLGGPYDVVMITNVLHHFTEERGVELIRRASSAMEDGGRIVLVGFTVDEDEAPACDPAPHLFSILMLVWTHGGEVHSVAAYERMLAAGGFRNPVVHRVPSLPLRVIVAERAAGVGSHE
jgi:cyclopropane fatty-acyl-phospholipid synthase-like methyltransferase